MIDLDIEKGTVENSKDIKQEPKVYYSPRDFSEKPPNNDIHSEDEELLDNDDETQGHPSPIGRINRTTYSGSAIGGMIDGTSSNSNSGSKDYSDSKKMGLRKKQYIIEDLDPPSRTASMSRKAPKQFNSSYKRNANSNSKSIKGKSRRSSLYQEEDELD